MGSDADHLLQRASLLLERNRPEEAIAVLAEALAQEPENTWAHVEMALARLQVSGQRAKALESIDTAVSLDADDPSVLTWKAYVLAQLDKDHSAIEWADKAIALDPETAMAWRVRAMGLSGLNRWTEAEIACEKALELNPFDESAKNHLAVVLRAQGRLDEANAAVGDLLSHNAEDPHALATSGWAALQSGDREKAEEMFASALRIEPENQYAQEGMKETYRSRSLFYRLYLRWALFMQRFTEGQQLMLWIGMIVLFRVGRNLFEQMPLVAALLTVVFFGFVFWSWLAPGIGDFLLLRDPQARLTLNREERLHGLVIGGGFLLGFCLLVLGFTGVLGSGHSIGLIGGCMMGACIPGSAAFFNLTIGRYLFGAIGLAVLGIGFYVAFGPGPDDSRQGTISLAFLLVMGSSWLAQVRSLRRGTAA